LLVARRSAFEQGVARVEHEDRAALSLMLDRRLSPSKTASRVVLSPAGSDLSSVVAGEEDGELFGTGQRRIGLEQQRDCPQLQRGGHFLTFFDAEADFFDLSIAARRAFAVLAASDLG